MKYGPCKQCQRDEYLDESGKCPVCQMTKDDLLQLAKQIVFHAEMAKEPKMVPLS